MFPLNRTMALQIFPILLHRALESDNFRSFRGRALVDDPPM